VNRARVIRAIALATIAILALSVPVNAGVAYRKLTSTMDYYTIYATFIHDGKVECPNLSSWYYRVKMKTQLGSVTSSTFVVDDVWITYEVVRGTAWSNLFFITGSFNRWPTSGTRFQGDYITAGHSKTYHYDVNKTFTKDGTLENRSSFSDPGICDTTDNWALYLY
jgi:hypothetical protein